MNRHPNRNLPRRAFLSAGLSALGMAGGVWVGGRAGEGMGGGFGGAGGGVADGYRGIWFELGQKSQYGDKYSGGLGTYTANHVPMAVYAPEVGRTFFVYGGTRPGERHLLAMASWYDHRRHRVPRPVVVHDKGGVNDPHDNPSLCLDGAGHLWVFVSGRARGRPGVIHRSREPYSVSGFERVAEREFTYPQPRWVEGRGFVFLFTKYTRGRELYWSTSVDGRVWSPDRKLAGMGGHYQTSHQRGTRIFTTFNRHPGGNVDRRTDLYLLSTGDGGDTWRDVTGAEVAGLPLEAVDGPARVHDFGSEGRLVYIHDLDVDESGRPMILMITSADHRPGPAGAPRWWTVARWLGDRWDMTRVAPANHNYTTGALYPLGGGRWRILGPVGRGPQPVGGGGEVEAWGSRDGGESWRRERRVTRGSRFNHNYVRRALGGHPEFAAFWADGDPDRFSESRLYFSDISGRRVWRLPERMSGEEAAPERV